MTSTDFVAFLIAVAIAAYLHARGPVAVIEQLVSAVG